MVFSYVLLLDGNNTTNVMVNNTTIAGATGTNVVHSTLATQLNNLPLSSEILSSLITGEASATAQSLTDKLNSSESNISGPDIAATVSNSQM